MTTTTKEELNNRIEQAKATIASFEADGQEAPDWAMQLLEGCEMQLKEYEEDEQVAETKCRRHSLTARPKAGSAATNQYGTFAVRYASQKQTNYIGLLLSSRELGGIDPKVLDIDELRTQVAKTEVNKKAASDIIDTLLAQPEKTVTVATVVAGERPASDRQREFVRQLLTERQGIPAAEAIRAELNEAREARQLTFTFVSHVIDRLLHISVPSVDVPEGRYALPSDDGHYVFWKVDRPTQGTWAGYTFVNQLIGSVGDWTEQRTNKAVAKSVLARIADDVEEAARMFGIKAKACGYCASPLSNIQSRAAGYGETCANNHGFYYPTEEEAKKILQERGED